MGYEGVWVTRGMGQEGFDCLKTNLFFSEAASVTVFLCLLSICFSEFIYRVS
jgi:hypothetical protein